MSHVIHFHLAVFLIQEKKKNQNNLLQYYKYYFGGLYFIYAILYILYIHYIWSFFWIGICLLLLWYISKKKQTKNPFLLLKSWLRSSKYLLQYCISIDWAQFIGWINIESGQFFISCELLMLHNVINAITICVHLKMDKPLDRRVDW